MVMQKLKAVGREASRLVADAWSWSRDRRRQIAWAAVVVAVGFGICLWFDERWLVMARVPATPLKGATSRWLSFWGDYYTGSLIVVAVLATLGWVFRRVRWRRAALAALLAASMAGMGANVFRFGLGRPRPLAAVPDGLYGPKGSHKYHAFPSAHSATAFATSTTLLVAVPAVGGPLMAMAIGVGWSRLYHRWHRPSDVWVGASLGILFGCALGSAARRRRDPEAISSPVSRVL